MHRHTLQCALCMTMAVEDALGNPVRGSVDVPDREIDMVVHARRPLGGRSRGASDPRFRPSQRRDESAVWRPAALDARVAQSYASLS